METNTQYLGNFILFISILMNIYQQINSEEFKIPKQIYPRKIGTCIR